MGTIADTTEAFLQAKNALSESWEEAQKLLWTFASSLTMHSGTYEGTDGKRYKLVHSKDLKGTYGLYRFEDVVKTQPNFGEEDKDTRPTATGYRQLSDDELVAAEGALRELLVKLRDDMSEGLTRINAILG